MPNVEQQQHGRFMQHNQSLNEQDNENTKNNFSWSETSGVKIIRSLSDLNQALVDDYNKKNCNKTKSQGCQNMMNGKNHENLIHHQQSSNDCNNLSFEINHQTSKREKRNIEDSITRGDHSQTVSNMVWPTVNGTINGVGQHENYKEGNAAPTTAIQMNDSRHIDIYDNSEVQPPSYLNVKDAPDHSDVHISEVDDSTSYKDNASKHPDISTACAHQNDLGHLSHSSMKVAELLNYRICQYAENRSFGLQLLEPHSLPYNFHVVRLH
jgi:hypothetical protein